VPGTAPGTAKEQRARQKAGHKGAHVIDSSHNLQPQSEGEIAGAAKASALLRTNEQFATNRAADAAMKPAHM